MRPVGFALASLLVVGCLAAAATARTLSGPGRRPLQLTTTFQVDWDLAYGASTGAAMLPLCPFATHTFFQSSLAGSQSWRALPPPSRAG